MQSLRLKPLGYPNWSYVVPRNLLQPLCGTLEHFWTFTWNPYLEPRNLLEPLRGTRTWNFGTFRNLTRAWNPLPEPSLGTFSWNLGTSWNLLDPLLGTSRVPLDPKAFSCWWKTTTFGWWPTASGSTVPQFHPQRLLSANSHGGP